MSIIPEGEQLRRATKWISERRIEHPEAKLFKLVEEACVEFDLPPKDEAFLIRMLSETGPEESK